MLAQAPELVGVATEPRILRDLDLDQVYESFSAWSLLHSYGISHALTRAVVGAFYESSSFRDVETKIRIFYIHADPYQPTIVRCEKRRIGPDLAQMSLCEWRIRCPSLPPGL